MTLVAPEGQSVLNEARWRSRGYLPHFESGEAPQAVTFRLADSLPASLRAEFERDLIGFPGVKARLERRKRMEAWLGQGVGACWLGDPKIASMVEGAIRHLDGGKYLLHAWVVMPNHVHLLLTPIPPSTLPGITHSLKSYTAKEANALLGRSGPFWQREYFDRAIRNGEHFRAEVEYIEANPLKANLCAQIADWPFSSAQLRA